MQTIRNIIERENEALRFHVEKEYNIKKLNFDNQVNSIKKVCSEKKMNKSKNCDELTKLQNAITIKEENLFRIRLFLLSVLIISFVSLGIWWGFEGWGLFFSIIGAFFIITGLGGLHIIPEFFEEYFCKVDPLPDYILDRMRIDISKIKDSNEKLIKEISALEIQLKAAQESSPKIEDIEKYYNNKDFFEKIHIPEYQNNTEFDKRDQVRFNVVLKSPGTSLLTVVKTIKELFGLDLKEAKYIVESVPKVIKEGAGAYEVNLIKARLEEAGAEIEIVKQ